MTLSSIEQYGSGFQTKVISALLTNKEFLLNINDILNHEDFPSPANQWIIKEIIKYYDKYHTNPSLEVLTVEVKKIENDVLKIAVKEQLKEAFRVSDEDDLNYVKEEFSNFCKNQQLKKALLGSIDMLKVGDYDSIRGLIDNALKAGQDKSIGHEYEKDTETRYREDHRTIVPTPWPQINDLIQGGIGNGDFGLIFGNPGGGKSWSLVSLGAYAVTLGYNVIHYTLELGEAYVGRRYDAFFTQIPVNEIVSHRPKVEKEIKDIKGKLIIKEYPTGKASISTIENHIKKCIGLDFKPDLIIIDYVDLLRSKKKNREKKEEIDDIYISTKGLARELNLPIWSVSQVNRAGAKDDVIEGDKSSGSYDKIFISDICISLSRKKEDKINGTGRFHIMKNRYGLDGMTYNVNVDTSTGHISVLDEYDGTSSDTTSSDPNTDFRKQLSKKFFEINS